MPKNKVISFRVSEEEQQLFREILAERNLTPIQLITATFLPKTDQERDELLSKYKLNNERKAELERELKAEQEQEQTKEFFNTQLSKIDIFLNHADSDRQALAIETATEIKAYLKAILDLNTHQEQEPAQSQDQGELLQEIDFLNSVIDGLNEQNAELASKLDYLKSIKL